MKAKLVNESVQEFLNEREFSKTAKGRSETSLELFDLNSYSEEKAKTYLKNLFILRTKKNGMNMLEAKSEIESWLKEIFTEFEKGNFEKIINVNPFFKYYKYSQENEE